MARVADFLPHGLCSSYARVPSSRNPSRYLRPVLPHPCGFGDGVIDSALPRDHRPLLPPDSALSPEEARSLARDSSSCSRATGAPTQGGRRCYWGRPNSTYRRRRCFHEGLSRARRRELGNTPWRCAPSSRRHASPTPKRGAHRGTSRGRGGRSASRGGCRRRRPSAGARPPRGGWPVPRPRRPSSRASNPSCGRAPS